MDIDRLRRFVASTSPTFGQAIARRMAVNRIAAGHEDGGAVLVGLAGPDILRALVEAGVPAPMLRWAIDASLLWHFRELPGVIERVGGRAVFAAWCRRAGSAPTEALPAIVDLYRGTTGCSPADAAQGLHWTVDSTPPPTMPPCTQTPP